MSLNWIDVNEFDFNCLLLMERFQLQYLLETENAQLRGHLGTALNGNPAVAWYIAHRIPSHEETVARLMAAAAPADNAQALRQSEVFVLGWMEDFVTYTRPEMMENHCDFVYGWDKQRLFELADLTGKRVLDVGSGSGRLAFAAAEKAGEVYACEPVETLRHYMHQKARQQGIDHIRIADGMADRLPWPDNTFDVVMSGHVVGDDLDRELAELTRVCRDGGWILDCPGDQHFALEPNEALITRGFECLPYMGSFGAQVCRYRKQVRK